MLHLLYFLFNRGERGVVINTQANRGSLSCIQFLWSFCDPCCSRVVTYRNIYFIALWSFWNLPLLDSYSAYAKYKGIQYNKDYKTVHSGSTPVRKSG